MVLGKAALTVDLEPDWGVRGHHAYTQVLPRFLRFLEARSVRATFFVCSDLLEVSEEPVARIAERHEVASHGCSHRRLDGLSRRAAFSEVAHSRYRLLEVAPAVRGFRAPFFRRARGHFALLSAAGYEYDSSVGSIWPGPQNGWLGMPAARHCAAVAELPTGSLAGGFAPLSLTYLRLLAPLADRLLPTGGIRILYMHLHEFLPPETAGLLPRPLRAVLTRNCGEVAWHVLERALKRLDCQYVTCADLAREGRESTG